MIPLPRVRSIAGGPPPSHAHLFRWDAVERPIVRT